MPDLSADPETGRLGGETQDTQPLLQESEGRDYPEQPGNHSSVFWNVSQWTRAFRLLPTTTRVASPNEIAVSDAPSPSNPHPDSPIALPSSASTLASAFVGNAPSVASSPSASPTKRGIKNDWEALALRSIDTICDEGSGLSKKSSGTCVICMEQLSPEEFKTGEAITLECNCKGDMALRHKSCAEKWAQVKGSNVCDICKAPIANLPPVVFDERDLEDGMGDVMTVEMGENLEEALQRTEMPAAADYVFDCIRVTWVSMIICILFFNATVSKAFVTGLMIGIAYTAFCKALHRSAQYRAALLANAAMDSPRGPTPALVMA